MQVKTANKIWILNKASNEAMYNDEKSTSSLFFFFFFWPKPAYDLAAARQVSPVIPFYIFSNYEDSPAKYQFNGTDKNNTEDRGSIFDSTFLYLTMHTACGCMLKKCKLRYCGGGVWGGQSSWKATAAWRDCVASSSCRDCTALCTIVYGWGSTPLSRHSLHVRKYHIPDAFSPI